MGLRFGHVVWISAVLALGAFVYVVGFAPIDEERSPRAAAIDREPTRGVMVASIRRSMAQGQVAGALRMANLFIEHNPEDPSGYFYRGLVERMSGDDEASLSDFAILDGLMRGLVSWAERYTGGQLDYFRAWGKFGIGDIEASVALFGGIADTLEQQSLPEDGGEITNSGVLYNLACYRAMSGEKETAIGLWERAIEHGYGQDGGWWAVDPDLESLHDDERFWGVSGQIRSSERDRDRPVSGGGAGTAGP